jgi:hypothetical protein
MPVTFIGGGGGTSPFLLDIINELGLSTGLIWCNDAADTRSYDGSSQTWTDMSSSTGDFWRGDDSGAASDPVFVGTAGVADEGTYFRMDGAADFFVGKTNGEPPTHLLARDGETASMLFIWYNANATSSDALWATDTGGGSVWTIWLTASGGSDRMSLRHATDNAGSIATETSTTNISRDAWHMLGLNYDEPNTRLDWIVDSTTEADETTSASTRTSTTALQSNIGTDVGGNTVPDGTRIMCGAIWNTNIGTAAFASIYSRLKTRRVTSLP